MARRGRPALCGMGRCAPCSRNRHAPVRMGHSLLAKVERSAPQTGPSLVHRLKSFGPAPLAQIISCRSKQQMHNSVRKRGGRSVVHCDWKICRRNQDSRFPIVARAAQESPEIRILCWAETTRYLIWHTHAPNMSFERLTQNTRGRSRAGTSKHLHRQSTDLRPHIKG